ncbi:hypothetical protein FJY84_07985 [Candidatus Bathyarchaeota archaeon]|nr:hypothetical protein [Candidatus Bathyarchaeota archaeon]
MEIESFEIFNFKSILDSGRISLPGLTMFLGANSSGKSSLGQSLLLMKQTFSTEDPSTPLVLNGPVIQCGEFRDLIHKRKLTTPIIINFYFKLNIDKPYRCDICSKEYTKKRFYKDHIKNRHQLFFNSYVFKSCDEKESIKDQTVLQFQYKYKKPNISLQKLELSNPMAIAGLRLKSLEIEQTEKRRIGIRLINKQNKQIFYKKFRYPKQFELINHSSLVKIFDYITLGDRVFFETNLKFNEKIALIDEDITKQLEEEIFDRQNMLKGYRYFTQFHQSMEPNSLSNQLLKRINYLGNELNTRLTEISSFLTGIHYVGPIRNWPERIYFGSGGKSLSVGIKGEHIQKMLWNDKWGGHEALIKLINESLYKMKLNIKIEIVPLGVGEIYQLRVKDKRLSINISDVGFGISQVLPIITECINLSLKESEKHQLLIRKFQHSFYEQRSENKVIYTEQPEIHLNPKIQTELADFFINLLKHNICLIIETHSEHILTRIQRRIAENKLDPKSFVIYYFDKRDNVTKIQEIQCNQNGVFNYWPNDGFFQDDYEDSIEILKKSISTNKGE